MQILERIIWSSGTVLLLLCTAASSVFGGEPALPIMEVLFTQDFEVTGDGQAAAWQKVPWTDLHRRNAGTHSYRGRVKMLYSKTGVYVLMDGTDSRVTATLGADFEDLWTEDVFEFFFWPDEQYPVYFEYEISPLNHELPILIPNFKGDFLGWRPWHYEGDRKTRKAVTITGGTGKPGTTIKGWSAEVFVPFALLKPLQNIPPATGTKWRANFYRVDYDDKHVTSWDWARVGPNFHEVDKFGTLVFR